MSDRQAIIAKTAENMRWWKSIQIDATERIEHSAGSLVKQSDYHYAETAAGERRLSTVMTLGDGAVHRTEQSFDGRTGTAIQPDKDRTEKQKTARIGKSFGKAGSAAGPERPVPLKYDYVGKVPLYEALEQARDLCETQFDATPCDSFLFEDVLVEQVRQNLLYHLGREDAVPVRVAS